MSGYRAVGNGLSTFTRTERRRAGGEPGYPQSDYAATISS